VIGLILLGGVPAALFVRDRLVTPHLAVVVLFAWAFSRIWRSLEPGHSSIGFQPDAVFGLRWFVSLAAAERAFRRTLGNGVSTGSSR
jgi:hypothetical protein